MRGCAKYEFEWDQRTRSWSAPTRTSWPTELSWQFYQCWHFTLILAVQRETGTHWGEPFSHLYPVSSVVFDHWIWPADGGIVVRIKKNFVSNLEHEEGGRREEGGGESFTGYSNWEGIRMPLPSLLTPPTTIKKLKPKLFFVIQDQTV